MLLGEKPVQPGIEFIWVLHAIAWKYCQLSWIQKFLKTKELPELNEKGIKTYKEIADESTRFMEEGNLTEEDIVEAFYSEEGKNLVSETSLNKLISHCPYVFITDSEIKKYLNRQDLNNLDIFRMVLRTSRLSISGDISIWAYIKEDGTRSWRGGVYEDRLTGLCYFPDEPKEEIERETPWLKDLASNKKSPGRKRLINGKKEDVINHLYVFKFLGHDWGIAFLKNCILRGVDAIDRKVYKLKIPAQMLYFANLWIDKKRHADFYLTTEEVCQIVGWRYPQLNMRQLRSNVQNLLNYMWIEGALERRLDDCGFYVKSEDKWFIMPSNKLAKRE